MYGDTLHRSPPFFSLRIWSSWGHFISSLNSRSYHESYILCCSLWRWIDNLYGRLFSGRIKAAQLWWHVMTYAWLTDIPKLLVGIMFMRKKSFGLHICSFPGFFVVSFMRGKIKTRVSSKCLWIHLLATSIPMYWLLVQSYRMVIVHILCFGMSTLSHVKKESPNFLM